MSEILLMQLVKALSQMGLTIYESKAYIALLQHHPANGNEISRASEVPGPKIYETLDRLAKKGLVVPLETDPVTYEPLPYIEFLKNKEIELKNNSQLIKENLGKLMTAGQSPHLIWHIRGYEALTARAGEMINNSEKEVLISFWEEHARDIVHLLEGAVSRNVRVVSLQFGPGVVDVGAVYRHVLLDTVYERHGNEISLVADGNYCLFMNLIPGREWEGYWTTNPGVIRMVTNYIRHDIYVNKIVERFGTVIFEEYGQSLEKLLNI